MAWNSPDGNNQDPWGGNNRGGKQEPPDLDAVFRKLQDKLNNIFGGGKGGGSVPQNTSGSFLGIFIIGMLVLVSVYLWNAVYAVDEKERAVILRLGVYHETVNPGLHLYFPGIEEKFQERVTEYRTYNLRTKMLTKDENIVEVAISVQYNISDVKDYVLNIAKPLNSLEEAAQSAFRHVVGGSAMHQVLTEGRETMGIDVRNRIQSYLDIYKSGLNVRKVNVESAQPPKEVQASFDDVIRAREDEERAKNKAESYSNKIIPEARGLAQRAIEDATGYREEVIAKSEGEAYRFNDLYREYRKAPGVTRERLYLAAVEAVLVKTSTVLVDIKGGNNMMYLPLDKLTKTQGDSLNTQTRDLNDAELNEVTSRVTEALNQRMSNARSSSSSNSNSRGRR
ncbi:MAG: FtsH protease activity modulator HflK [Candidatus Endonucleobacter sp. (ex Gigantidas childressi)]|nr:FtsH protease activity modulator HflK [Candidatus Endonucleobacter sp. (ex Gigantidas childressi)]